MRKPFQGTLNIIRFNWHLYAGVFILILVLLFTAIWLPVAIAFYVYLLCLMMTVSTLLSLLVSAYVYDISPLYGFPWIMGGEQQSVVVNIHAGFDEVSGILKDRFKNASHFTLDFYDSAKHTEKSIQRARMLYPPATGTIQVSSTDLKLPAGYADQIFVIFAAHEIRDPQERTVFFKELHKLLKPNGHMYVTEHMRDLPNLLAYNIGFLHFYSKASWLKIFKMTGLNLIQEIKTTPFIITFILQKHGDTP